MKNYILIYVLVILISVFTIFRLRNVKTFYRNSDIDVNARVKKTYSSQKDNKWPVTQTIGFFIFMLGLPILFTILYQKSVKTSEIFAVNEIFFLPSWLPVFLALFFILMPFSTLILMMLYLIRDRLKKTSEIRPCQLVSIAETRLILLVFVVVFAIAFPFVALNSDQYTYYSEGSLFVDGYWALEEKEYVVTEDVKYAKVSYDRHDGDYRVYYHIYFDDGRDIELLRNNYWRSEKIVYLNEALIENNVEIKRIYPASSEWKRMSDQFPEKVFESISKLYGIYTD